MTQIETPKTPFLYDPAAPLVPVPPAEPEVAKDHRVTVLVSMSEKHAKRLIACTSPHGVILSYRASYVDYREIAPVEIIAIGSLPELDELPSL